MHAKLSTVTNPWDCQSKSFMSDCQINDDTGPAALLSSLG